MAIEAIAAPLADYFPEAPFYIPATGAAMRPRRTLKHDDTFVVVDSHGDIGASAGGSDGLFHADTRFVSRLELLLNGTQPLLNPNYGAPISYQSPLSMRVGLRLSF